MVQRVSKASVSVDGQVVGEIGLGLVVFVGVNPSDTEADAAIIADKVVTLRVFSDAEGKMNLAVGESEGGVLVISQFTLYGDVRRGRRPSFTDAAPPEVAAPLVEEVARLIAAAGLSVATGRFGAKMAVSLVNDGPVTLLLETQGGRLV